MPEDDSDEEMLVIDDEDGDTDSDGDICARKGCEEPRSQHEDGYGPCSGCSTCPRFLAS